MNSLDHPPIATSRPSTRGVSLDVYKSQNPSNIPLNTSLDPTPAHSPLRFSDLDPLTPRRILIVKPSALGDIIHAIPVARLVKQRYPQAELHWLVVPAFRNILERCPWIDETILFERSSMSKRSKRAGGAFDFLDLGSSLEARRYDMVIDLQGLLRTGLLSLLTHAPVRVGFAYAREGAWIGYTHRVPKKPGVRHAIERYLDLAQALGCPRGPLTYDYGLDDADHRSARELLDSLDLSGKPLILLFPGTNWMTKRWPARHFDTLAHLIEQQTGCVPVVAGAGDAVELSKQIHAKSLAGRTTLRQLAAILQQASACVTNDSGPMHLAASLAVPTLALFGPTNPHLTGPYDTNSHVLQLPLACSPCLSRRCSHHTCLQNLSPQSAFQILSNILTHK